MNRAILVLLLSCLVQLAFSQSIPKLKRLGDKHFDASQYAESIKYYEKIIRLDKNNEEAIYKLATSYYRTLQYTEAKKFYQRVIGLDSKEYLHLSYYYFGSILKLESQFPVADSVLGYLLTLPSVDDNLLELARKQKEGCVLAINQKKANRGFSIREMTEVNSDLHDFGATVSPDGQNLVFVTTRNLQGQQYKAIQYAGLLPDLVQFDRRGDRWRMNNSKDNFDVQNTQWAEGAGSFTADGSIFYFTSCRTNDGSDCKIMISKKVNGKWGEPKALNEYINPPNSENKHPSISKSGDTLFFVSDREGGLGGSDIWMSLKGLEEDSWTPAINMGDKINTRSNEITPYYSSSFQCLLYASDGHIGYGGYDLFAAKGESFFEPQIYNLGDPFNSSLDDTYFSIADSAGFISSNRKDKSHLNLYAFNVSNEKLFLSLLISGESLIDERIISRYKEIRTLDLITFRVEDYQGFEVFDPVKRKKPKPAILNDDPFEDTGETLLAENNIETPDVSDNFKTRPTVGFETDASDVERTFSQSRRPPTTFERKDGGYEYEKLYFEFGSAVLTNQAKVSLAQLVNQLSGSQDLIETIQIIAHTDQIGTAQYNFELSAKRGEAIKNFLETKGLKVNNISISASGESNLLTADTTWYDRLFNRRAELLLYGQVPSSLSNSRILVAREDLPMSLVLSLLKITKEQFNDWNKIDATVLKQGQIIRVNRSIEPVALKYFLDETDIKYNFSLYVVKEGETLASVSKKFGTPEELLVEINEINTELQGGDQIFVYRPNF